MIKEDFWTWHDDMIKKKNNKVQSLTKILDHELNLWDQVRKKRK